MNYRLLSDEELNGHFLAKDDRAFEEIYNRYALQLYGYARRTTKDDDMSKDIVQDVFTSLYSIRHKLSRNIQLSAYLHQSVKNTLINKIKHDKVKEKYRIYHYNADSTPFLAPLEALIRKETYTKIQDEISLLHPKMRSVYMANEGGQSYQEIAQKHQITINTVRSHLFTARKLLRSRLSHLLTFLCL